MDIKIFDPKHALAILEIERIADFLMHHLEQYGDTKSAITKAILYAQDPSENKGGYIITGEENGELIGAVVINSTGMEEYIPENILVYIAIHGEHRGKGVGRQLMQQAISSVPGNIALHVEKDNPAKFLYEKLGFTTPYLEMRLKK